MKIISVVGDSHTWGQGVGAEGYFTPGLYGGDLRMNSFEFPFYVNLIREYVNARTGSVSVDYCRDKLVSLCESFEDQFGIIDEKPLKITEKFGFCRLFFVAEKQDTTISISINSKLCKEITYKAMDMGMNSRIVMLNIFADNDGVNTLEILAKDNRVLIQRMEFYSGEYAVVNCGVGSCPVKKYNDVYLDHYVGELCPHSIIFEGCTINDWLADSSSSEYYDNIIALLDRMKALTPNIICHTPFPIGGNQYANDGKNLYLDFIDTMRNAVKDSELTMVDTYAIIEDAMRNIPENGRHAFLYADNWHPNATGNFLYARHIIPELEKIL